MLMQLPGVSASNCPEFQFPFATLRNVIEEFARMFFTLEQSEAYRPNGSACQRSGKELIMQRLSH
jgi:hypothetical protein